MTGSPRRALVPAAVLATALLAGAACEPGPPRPPELRMATDSFLFTVTTDPVPPRAREDIVYKVVVRDRESREPLDGGEGRIFASSRDGASTWDALTRGSELGTYYGTLNYITAGEWAVAVQFRRDTTRAPGDTAGIHRIDWMQDVRGAREPGDL